MGFADYQWVGADGHSIQVERKQVDELLSGMDHTEEQLRRWLSNGTEETYLIYEGMFEPIAGLKQTVQSWHKTKDGRLMVPGRHYSISYAGVMAWFYQLDKAGVTVINTCDYIGTAITLSAWYKSSQQPEHTTLKRYIKKHIYPEPQNPHVLHLMSIKGAEIGEVKAKALIERFGTFWYTVNQEPFCIAETQYVDSKGHTRTIGMAAANKLLKCIGRTA
jgi:ERCC4-type nuclease